VAKNQFNASTDVAVRVFEAGKGTVTAAGELKAYERILERPWGLLDSRVTSLG